MSKLRQSDEDYLETILILSKRGEVRSIDIANEMNLSKPSVSRAMGILKNGGFIKVDKDGYITFTEKETAERSYSNLSHKIE